MEIEALEKLFGLIVISESSETAQLSKPPHVAAEATTNQIELLAVHHATRLVPDYLYISCKKYFFLLSAKASIWIVELIWKNCGLTRFQSHYLTYPFARLENLAEKLQPRTHLDTLLRRTQGLSWGNGSVFQKNTRARTENMFGFLHITWEWKEVQCWYWHHCLHNVNTYKPE